MRILHLVDGIPPAVLGGTGRIATEVARGQTQAGDTVGILSAAKPGALPASIHGVQLLSIEPSSDRWAHWRCVLSRALTRRVVETINSFQPDVIHAHTISRQIGYGWMAHAKASGIRIVMTCHDVSHVAYGKVTGGEKHLWLTEAKRHGLTWNPLRHILIKRALRHADVIMTVSDALREYLTRRGIPNLRTVHNGIDTGYWKPEMSKEEARAALKLPQDAFLFLLTGRMGVDKGSTLIASALPKDAHLVLAGDRFSEFGPVKDRSHIFLNQTADQMKLHYTAADVTLVPSRCLDCFPTVCLESMAMGCPVMATSWGGAKESVQHGITGWILNPLDADAWRTQMAWCIKNKTGLDTFGKAGRERMRTFDLTAMLRKLKEAYAL